jgi:HEAT repeat protein
MRWFKAGTAYSIFLALIICVLVGLVVKDILPIDTSCETQVRALDSHWAGRRKEAATALAQFPGKADTVVPALVKALGDPDTEVRLSALESLVIFGEKSKPAGPVLRKMLGKDMDRRIRQRAAALLGVIEDRDAIPSLVKGLDDSDPGVRLEATRSLGRIGGGVASGPVVEALLATLGSDQSEELRKASIETLDSLGRNQERVARALAEAAAKDAGPQVRAKAVSMMKRPAFDFQFDALIAALEDPTPQVRLTAGANLASIGLTDDRTVPALCRAALHADYATREGIGLNIEQLALQGPDDKTPDDRMARRYQAAVLEFQSVLETRGAAAREQILNVLARLIVRYQESGKPALMEPARAAAAAALARIEDEHEEISLRIHAVNLWTAIQPIRKSSGPGRAASRSAAPAARDELHARALWIAALARAVTSAAAPVRFRSLEILADSFNDPGTDPSFREAWRKAAPALARATASEDGEVRIGALAILNMLGPEAGEALPALRTVLHKTRDSALRSAAEKAIKSISCADDLNAKNPALRIAAASALGQFGWRAAPALPALIATLKDGQSEVRLAVVNALGALGHVSATAVTPLAIAQAGEADAVVRAAIVRALEAIAPGTPPVLDAHVKALRDPDPRVREAAARFQDVPADDSVVSPLGSALADPNEKVRLVAAGSLTRVLFANPAVVPVLCKALGDRTRRTTVLETLGSHLETTSDWDDWVRAPNLPGLKVTLGAAIPALTEALSLKDEAVSPVVFGLLGRILSFSAMSKNEELRKSIEPALQVYLNGLHESDPSIREEVLSRLDSIPIRRAEIVAALRKFLERSDQSAEDRESALLALKAQSAVAGSDAGKGSGGD